MRELKDIMSGDSSDGVRRGRWPCSADAIRGHADGDAWVKRVTIINSVSVHRRVYNHVVLIQRSDQS